MRPNTAAVIERQSNFAGKTTRMTIDASAIDHIIGQLTDLYSDPALAVIREYSTNAWDSHRDAGNNEPIAVTLPSTLKRQFIVEDFGVGLSAQELDEIYSKYGASTKRDSDDVVGMLGFGCKSALTYTDQFWIRCRKNGLETQVSIAKGKTGVGEIDFISVDQPTSERDGVRVTINVKNVDEFCRKAQNFFRFWKPGSVLVNGKQPALSTDPVVWLDADTAVFKSVDPYASHAGVKDYIVMGNVGYPIAYDRLDGRVDRKLGGGYSFVRWVPIGSVNFPPNREELQYTKRTVDTCIEAAKFVKEELRKHLEAEIDKLPTHQAAYEKAVEFAKIIDSSAGYNSNYTRYQSGTFKYKGVPIPNGYDDAAPKDQRDAHGQAAWSRLFNFSGYGEKKGLELGPSSSFQFNYHPPKLVITEFEHDRLTPYRRRKVAAWLKQQNMSEGIYVLLTKSATFECPWIESKQVKWSKIEEIKLTKDRNTTVKYQQFIYDATGYYGCKAEEKTIDQFDGLDVVYYSNADIAEAAGGRRGYAQSTHPKALLAYDQTLVLVQLGKGSWAKFEREHDGGCTHIDQWIKQEIDRVVAGISTTQKLALTLDYTDRDALKRLDTSAVLDAELSKLVLELTNVKNIDAVEQKLNALRNIIRWAGAGSLDIPITATSLDSYPLLRYAKDRKTATEYVNAVFKYRETTPV